MAERHRDGTGDAPLAGERLRSARGGAAGGVTPRAVAIALALLVVLAPATFGASTLWAWNYYLTAGSLPAWSLSLLVLLTAGAGVPALRRFRFSRAELLTVYAIRLVAAPLFSASIMFYVIPKVMLYYHVARANPAYEISFIPHIPTWWCPTTEAARWGFFIGQSQVPWRDWAVPLLAWSSFMVALFTATLCVLALLQSQWITRERLTFPLARVPLETVRGTSELDGWSRLPVGWVFWLGVLVSGSVTFLARLGTYFPTLPRIPIGDTLILPWQKVGPMAGIGEIFLSLQPYQLGIFYTLPKELLFSCWFFMLVRIALHIFAIAAGATPQQPDDWYGSNFPAPYYQCTGAVMMIGFWSLWSARRHLARALRNTFSPQPGADDAREPLGYRWAVLGFMLSVAWMVGFFWLSGCRIAYGLAAVVVIVGAYVANARVRAETSLDPSGQDFCDFMTRPFGSAIFRPVEIIGLVTMRWATFQDPSGCFGTTAMNALESYKVADEAGINKRKLTQAFGLAFIVALALGIFIYLTGIYYFGYFDTTAGIVYSWPSLQSRTSDPFGIYTMLLTPSKADPIGMLALGIGSLVSLVLGILRLRFWWWPLHPVGYIIAFGWGTSVYLTPFFITWAIKSLVTRYGGLRLYRATLPFAIGMVIGDVLNSGLWGIVALVTHTKV